MNPKLPISVTLIAKNEAHNLDRCLNSIKDSVNEIIIVINDCTDQTEEVANQHGAKVYHHPFQGFMNQKNYALSKANEEWILALDADEVISEELKNNLTTFFSKHANDYQGAYFPRKNFFLGRWIKHGDWYPDLSLRLFKKDSGIWAGGQLHEKIKLNGKAKRLEGDLLHYSFPTLNSLNTKLNQYSDLFLEQQLSKGKRWSCFSVLCRSLWRFIRAYFIRLGFLDGFPGFYIAIITAFSTFYKYSRLYEHQALQKKPNG